MKTFEEKTKKTSSANLLIKVQWAVSKVKAWATAKQEINLAWAYSSLNEYMMQLSNCGNAFNI